MAPTLRSAPAVTRPAAARVREVSVLVVDDEEVVQWGLRFLLESQPWVGRYVPAFDHAQAIARARSMGPDVAVVDMGLSGGQGLRTAEALRLVCPRSQLLLLSSGEIDTDQARAIGATGLTSKRVAGQQLVSIVKLVADGRRVFPALERHVSEALSRRERQVWIALAQGATNREIALRLGVSPETVKQHTRAMYRKLGVRNRTEAARLYEGPVAVPS